jgi:hypothetical protein
VHFVVLQSTGTVKTVLATSIIKNLFKSRWSKKCPELKNPKISFYGEKSPKFSP